MFEDGQFDAVIASPVIEHQAEAYLDRSNLPCAPDKTVITPRRWLLADKVDASNVVPGHWVPNLSERTPQSVTLQPDSGGHSGDIGGPPTLEPGST